MTIATLDQLIRPLSSDEVFELLLTKLEAIKVPARSWREGSVARSVLGVCAELGAQGSNICTSVVRGFFLAFGSGDYLTLHAQDVYGVARIDATFATGQVTLTNKGGGIHSIGADECIIRSSNTGARYRVSQAFVLGSGTEASPTSIVVNVMAVEPGSASSVGPTELDEFETPLTKVTVSNTASIVGRDAETDAVLVKRCLAKQGTWSPFGPRDAYEFAALTATLSDGSPTNITRVAVSRQDSKGRVFIVCATPSGAPTSDELEAVRLECERIARPDTVRVYVSGAVPKATAKTIRIWANGGSEPLLKSRAQAALAAMLADYPIGGKSKTDGGGGFLFDDKIAAAVVGSSAEIFDVDIIAGAGDIALAAYEVATNTTVFEVRIR